VLSHLDGVVTHRFLFGPQRKAVHVPGVQPVACWVDARRAVGQTLTAP
jgi:hypothetical protein